MMNICLLFFCLVISKVSVIQAKDKTLNIMGLLPMTGNVWPGGGACLTSAELALRHVNAREDILKDYKLDLTWRDSKVSTLIFFLGSHHREYLLIAFLCLIA